MNDEATTPEETSEVNDGRTVFVLGGVHEASLAAAALRAAGYQAVTGEELDDAAGVDRNLEVEIEHAAIASRDMVAALDCDIIAIVPGETPGREEIVRRALNESLRVEKIDDLVPSWREVLA